MARKMANLIVLYDFLLVKGGAEGLTLTLLDNLKEATLCVAFKDDNIFPDKNLKSTQLTTLS